MQQFSLCFSRVKKDCLKFIKSQETKADKFKNKERMIKSFLIPLCFWTVSYTHHNPRINPTMTGFNVGCIDEINTFDMKEVPVNDGQNHPLDKK